MRTIEQLAQEAYQHLNTSLGAWGIQPSYWHLLSEQVPASISTCNRSYGGESIINEWASAKELLDAGAINSSEYEALKEAEERRKAEERARLIKQAEDRLVKLKAA